jgi:F-type H+-transporting ATPase subunit delta
MKATRTARRNARHLFRLCTPAGVLDEERARRVTRQLTASRRREALAILSGFHRLVRLDRDRHTAVIESAVPLPPDIREDVNGTLLRRYGPGLHTSFVRNPALIAGMRIKVGSDVYDGTVLERLRALQSRL